jgi:purine-binding chemotaxis protein CheW
VSAEGLQQARERGDWQALARSAAAPHAEEETALLRELLAIELDATPYAVPVERVREIVRMRPITPMPRVPEAVRGVIALRGEVIQVIDLRRRLGLPVVEPTRRSRIVVLHAEDGRIAGLLVDAVTEVLRLPEHAIRATAAGESDTVEALAAREGRFVSLLNLERVMDVDRAD